MVEVGVPMTLVTSRWLLPLCAESKYTRNRQVLVMSRF